MSRGGRMAAIEAVALVEAAALVALAVAATPAAFRRGR
jgi:hypothetical protein